ncbi:MAG: ATP-binding protein [Chloroflexota bacterium]
MAKRTGKAGSEKKTKLGAEEKSSKFHMPGDPNCSICKGVGFIRRDLDVSDPDFGKVEICTCRQHEVTQTVRSKLYRLSNLSALKGLTFESFEVRGRVGLGKQQADSLEQAFNHAQNFAGSLKGWLLLMGRYGCGKTHLAAAIANQTVSLGVPTLFLTVPDLLDWLRYSYSSSEDVSFEERFEEIRNSPLLVMDDFGTQNATSWAQEKLFQIINYRYINQFATVITSNLQFADFEGRIRSRLMDPELVTQVNIMAPDYRNPKDDTGHPELSSLSLHGRQTFGNFSMRKDEGLLNEDAKSLQRAFESAKDFADGPQGWLILTGPYGSGKTHLAAAIGNYQTGLGNPPLMVVVPDLLDHLRATFNPNSSATLDRRFEEIRTARMLILDDLGTQSATPWAREKLYQLFNYRYNAELPTVITTASLLQDIDQRLYSRMQDTRLCKILVIGVPGYKGGTKPKSTNRNRTG